MAVTKIIAGVLEKNNIPGAVASLVTGGRHTGEALVENSNVDLGKTFLCRISTICSYPQSRLLEARKSAAMWARKFRQDSASPCWNSAAIMVCPNIRVRDVPLIYCIAAIVMPDADMSIAMPSVFFGSVGTAGQRCTSTRRLYLHRSIAPTFLESLQKAYSTVRIGDPLVASTLMGPLHTQSAVQNFHKVVMAVHESGGQILTGGKPFKAGSGLEDGNFVTPTIAIPASTDHTLDVWRKEQFVPVLNVAVFDELEEAIQWNNSVPQGLSSSLWTKDVRNVGKWIGPAGSDCGIVNVSILPISSVVAHISLASSRLMLELVEPRLERHLVAIRVPDGEFWKVKLILRY